jgi:1,2-diacylglycerol 3-alpha-glucosyltransferase
MRIAMMTNNYKPFVGGVPISIERLADSLRDLGHTVYVFAPDYKSSLDDDEYTFRFPTMRLKIAGAIPIPNLIHSYVKKTISTLDIDLIHVHHPVMIGNVATRLGKEFHIPVVFTYHTRYEQYLHYLKPFGYLQNKASQGNLMEASIIDFVQRQVIQRYLNHFLEKCDMVLAPTKSIKDYLNPFHIGTPVSIIPTGLPHVYFEKHIEATAIREKYLRGKQYLFCTVSRLAKEKNLPFLLRGVAAVKEQLGDIFNLLILGDGPEKENLIALSRTLKIDGNIFFVGEVPNQKISSYHQACDLFLFSSKSETQGIVLLEAMAAYLPIFAVRATGVSDVVVNGKNGVLSSDSIDEWVENLISILQNPAVLIKMKSSARNTALLYDEKMIANQILEHYTYLEKSYEAEHWLMLHLNGTSQPIIVKEY